MLAVWSHSVYPGQIVLRFTSSMRVFLLLNRDFSRTRTKSYIDDSYLSSTIFRIKNSINLLLNPVRSLWLNLVFVRFLVTSFNIFSFCCCFHSHNFEKPNFNDICPNRHLLLLNDYDYYVL